MMRTAAVPQVQSNENTKRSEDDYMQEIVDRMDEIEKQIPALHQRINHMKGENTEFYKEMISTIEVF